MIFVTGFVDDDGYSATTGAFIGYQEKAKEHAIATTPPDLEFGGPVIDEFDDNGQKAYYHRYRNGVWTWEKVEHATVT